MTPRLSLQGGASRRGNPAPPLNCFSGTDDICHGYNLQVNVGYNEPNRVSKHVTFPEKSSPAPDYPLPGDGVVFDTLLSTEIVFLIVINIYKYI